MVKSGLFVGATSTDVGKTFCSIKLLKQALEQGCSLDQIAYFKPVQCGSPTDYEAIQKAIPGITTYTSYDLKTPASPDYAAAVEGVEIKLEKIKEDYQKISVQHQFVIVEGAGGLAVPINDNDLVSDIAACLDLPMVLVIKRELGTINHSLLTIEHARSKGLDIKGIIVSELGEDDSRTRASIESIKRLGRVEEFDWCLNKN